MAAAILIVGAGPVGMTLAMALKRSGTDVRIVDKATARTDKSKALVMWPRTLELVDIQGCVQPFLDAGMKVPGARILANGNALVHVKLDTAPSAYRYALMIPQSETERVLEEQLEKLGVRVERLVELQSFIDDGDGVNAVLRDAGGRDETVRATYLVGCDGAHSTVRHGLAASFMGDTLPSDWALADIQIDGDIPLDEITICWTQDGILVFFPIAGRRFRVVADVGPVPADVEAALTLGEIQAILDARGPAGLRARDAVWVSRFRINERKVKDYSRGHVFLAGDAAHVHSPAGGQGMNTGMQDALNLAWKLAMVCQGHAAPALLDSYSPERSAIGDQVLRNAGNLTKIAIIRNPILREIRNLAAGTLGQIPALRQRIVDQLTEVDLHYADSPLTETPSGASRHPAGGDRAMDLPVSGVDGGATRLHEILRAGKFVVLSVGAPLVALPPPLRSIATAAGVTSDPGYESGHVYLIRPDAYVSLSTDADGIGSIIAALQRVVGPS